MNTLAQQIRAINTVAAAINTVAPAIITVAYCDAKIRSASRTVENGATGAMVERGLKNILIWTAKKNAIIASGI